MIRKWGISIVMLCILYGALPAKMSFKFSGYYKSFLSVYAMPDVLSGMIENFSRTIASVNNNIQLKTVIQFNKSISFEGAYHFMPTVKDPLLFLENPFNVNTLGPGYRLDDLDSRLYPKEMGIGGSFAIHQNLDRCFLTLQLGFADLFVGRQPIAWGSARFVNPTDILSPFTFNELDKEERRGVDGIRLRIPVGDMSELDIGYVANDSLKWRESALFVRGKTELAGLDLSLVAIKFFDNLLLGADLSGSIGGAGYWIEGAYVFSSLFNETIIQGKTAALDDSLRLSIGIEYNFSDKCYGFGEYHFNSIGSGDAEEYLIKTQTLEFGQGSIYLAGKHYLNLGTTYTPTPLAPVTAMLIYNLTDHSFVLAPSVEYNIAENVYLTVGGYLAFGKRAKILPTLVFPAGIVPRSEFGYSPSIIYSSFRYYF